VSRAGKAHTSEDIWHLSIDDLLGTPKEPARLAGRGPFVINLSTSTARIAPPPKRLRHFHGLHLYQLRRGPERRPTFLLRLGIIATEIEADAILSGVLEHYPGARKDSAEDDDRAAVAAKARPVKPPKPAQPPAEKPAEARQRPLNTAPPAPKVAAKPEEPFRWDIDEVLPDLAVTWCRSPQEREARKDGPAVVRPRPPVMGASRAQAPAIEQAPADRDRLAAAAAAAPGNLSPVREPLASRQRSNPRESAMQRKPLTPRQSAAVRETPAQHESAALPKLSSPQKTPALHESLTLRKALPSRETPALREPSAHSKPPARTKSKSLAAVATPSTEIEFSAPAPVEAAPARGVVEQIDHDPNAITDEVEITTLIAETLEIEAPAAAARKVEARSSETSSVESHARELITVEVSTSEVVTAEAPTIEAHELDVITLETSTTEAKFTEAPSCEAYALERLAAEAPPASEHEVHELRIEQATPAATESAAPSPPAAERPCLDAEVPVTSEPFTASGLAALGLTLAEKAHATATPAEVVSAFLMVKQALLDDIPVVAAAHGLALVDDSIAIGASARAPVENVRVILAAEAPTEDVAATVIPPASADEVHTTNAVDAPARIAAASVPKPSADSGTLEQLVAKIGALVESADAHDKDASSPQNLETAVSPPTPPAKPDRPVAASAIARPADRPSPLPRVPAVEPPPADAPLIDSTQTVRALTPLELADDQASQWFSIQLALSQEQIDPEHVPSLDIFNEYRLYSVTGLDHDRLMHALRLGFFSSALAAEAVASYLSGFFDSPCIKRVSLAERERFAERGVIARKDIGATGMHAVIELAGATPLPERRIHVSDSGKRRASRSVWSRLVAPRKR
jgi:hypothetical protein